MIEVFRRFIEFLGWCQIVLSPFLLCGVAGVVYYAYHPDQTGYYVLIAACIFGLVLGIVLATYIYRKYGAVNFLSKLSSSFTLQEKPKEKQD
jgi:hypothetical protein